MKIITTHLQADFDCVAAMAAAKKLYPDAVMVFPGSQEKNVRDFLAETGYQFPYRRLKHFDLAAVRLVIVVDTCTKERIGIFGELAERGDVEFHIYDHHTMCKTDLPATVSIVRERGSSATVMVETLREKNITVTPDEATLLALGVYEDTGSLTFSSTCPEDYEAAAWLLRSGANLNIVSEYIRHELNADQIDALNTFLKNIETRQIGGVTVAVTTASVERYVGDISALATKIMDIENYNVLFMLARMEGRIHLVARSRIPAVNAGEIAESMGGGGHPSAASATVKDITLPQIIEKLWATLATRIEPLITAGEIMVPHVVTVKTTDTLSTAEKLMTRYGINGMPVMSNGKVAGIITRQIVEKAIYHGMGDNSVQDFMISEFATVNPDTPFYVLEEVMLGGRQKLAPVVEKKTGTLLGVVSRGMALAKLYGDSVKAKPETEIHGRHKASPAIRDATGLMRERLPKEILKIFNLVSDVANKNGYTAYVVGGLVRDLLLRIPNIDLDIVIEGDGMDFARKLAARLGGRTRVHEKFKTAVVIAPNGFKIDVATARIEYYSHPAALPTVEMSAIRHDLYRRDFTMNTMAIRLNGAKPNALLDFFGGQQDIKDHIIRVLHNLSFVEDPTRAFRAVRFESRYGFTIGRQTLSLLRSAVDYQLFHRLSGSRVFAELRAILKERHSSAAINRMKELGLLRFVHPEIKFGQDAESLMEQCEDLITWHALAFPEKPVEAWMTRLMALMDELDNEQAAMMKLTFPTAERALRETLEERRHADNLLRDLMNSGSPTASRLYEMFNPLSRETLLFAAAKSRQSFVRNAVTRYLTELADIEPLLDGDDIIKCLNVKPSAEIGRVLKRVVAAQIDGEIENREEALALAKGMIKQK